MKKYIQIQDAAGATHVVFTRHITNLTIQSGPAKIHINSGGSSMTVHTKLTIKELLEVMAPDNTHSIPSQK
jgi:flagellar basal body P-ring protein FlgI